LDNDAGWRRDMGRTVSLRLQSAVGSARQGVGFPVPRPGQTHESSWTLDQSVVLMVPSACALKSICLSSELTAALLEGVALARHSWTHALGKDVSGSIRHL
jgi:hypothetical protein